MPDYASIDRDTLARTAVLYLCNPGNPQGAVASTEYLESLIRMAREYGFAVVFDECYSEIYRGEPPVGALEVCARMGGDLSNVLVMHSLSKRSSAPGIRVGTVAGDPKLIDSYRTIRSYAGVAVPMPLLKAGERLLRDEEHVNRNRAHYAELFGMAERILGNTPGFSNPPGGFYLWLDVGDGEEATRRLWREAAVRVIPGGYMAQKDPVTGLNPGDPYIRIALVHDRNFAEEALSRIANVLNR
jgi:N-succinyldiaminopimelate aminotransferase